MRLTSRIVGLPIDLTQLVPVARIVDGTHTQLTPIRKRIQPVANKALQFEEISNSSPMLNSLEDQDTDKPT